MIDEKGSSRFVKHVLGVFAFYFLFSQKSSCKDGFLKLKYEAQPAYVSYMFLNVCLV